MPNENKEEKTKKLELNLQINEPTVKETPGDIKKLSAREIELMISNLDADEIKRALLDSLQATDSIEARSDTQLGIKFFLGFSKSF